jgi:hypothetical protein
LRKKHLPPEGWEANHTQLFDYPCESLFIRGFCFWKQDETQVGLNPRGPSNPKTANKMLKMNELRGERPSSKGLIHVPF